MVHFDEVVDAGCYVAYLNGVIHSGPHDGKTAKRIANKLGLRRVYVSPEVVVEKVVNSHGKRRLNRTNHLIRRDGRGCYWCGTVPKTYTFDHVIPVALGGSNSIKNLVLCCRRCNAQKGDNHPLVWIARLLETPDNATKVPTMKQFNAKRKAVW